MVDTASPHCDAASASSRPIQLIDADHLTFRLKTPWSDGTTHLLLSPLELIEKLAALIPPPRLNLVRYHGILAPNARDRSQVVPDPPSLIPPRAPPQQEWDFAA